MPSGRERWRLPVAADTALARAPSTGGTPGSPTPKVRDLCMNIVGETQLPRGLRMQAAIVLGGERITNEASRTLLRKILLRDDDGLVQRSCLSTLVATADLKVVRELLLRRELYENDYYGTINCNGVNAAGDVCGVTTTSGLAWKIPGRVGDSRRPRNHGSGGLLGT